MSLLYIPQQPSKQTNFRKPRSLEIKLQLLHPQDLVSIAGKEKRVEKKAKNIQNNKCKGIGIFVQNIEKRKQTVKQSKQMPHMSHIYYMKNAHIAYFIKSLPNNL
eukprot:TRINITY_DN10324_c0_g1_i3.p7 TRINITY_DN10324_c0_g1~~TRINITY_DN10324_c0_g1_i3.p7  ORF type:complete len:105 (+),score=4.55 TRINITY_DN10324_c0_g1_i3:805-1119(+)